MNKAKRIFTLVLVMLFAFSSFSVYAEGVLNAYTTNNELNVRASFTDNSNGDVSLIVTKNGVSFEEYKAMSDIDKILATEQITQPSGLTNGRINTSVPFSGGDGEYAVTAISPNGESSTGMITVNETFTKDKIEELSTTSYAPYLKQYHLTTETQYKNNYSGGEGGQKGFAMEYSPIDTDMVFFGTDTSGIWKSTDGGKTWKNSSVGLGCFGVVAIMCDPNDVNIVYAAVCPNKTGSGTTNGVPNNQYTTDKTGIYVSYDKGATWNFEQQLDFYRHHTASLFAYNSGYIMCAGHNGKIYRRLGEGSWTLAHDIGETIYNFYAHSGVYYAATSNSGVVKCTDYAGESSWTSLTSGLDSNEVMSIAFNPVNDDIYCITRNYLYKYNSESSLFTQINTSKGIASNNSLTNANGQVFFGGIKNGNARLYVQQSSISYPLRYSDDYGETFSIMTMDRTLGFMGNKTGYGCEPVAVHPTNPDVIISSMDAEIYKSIDGGESFFASSSGFSGLRIMDIAFNPNNANDMFFGVMDFGGVKTIDKGLDEKYPLTKYVNLKGSNGNSAANAVARDPKNSNTILINVGSSIFKSVDNGDTFTKLESAEEHDTSGSILDKRRIFYNQNNTQIIYANRLISRDGGDSWEVCDYVIRGVSPTDGNVIYATEAYTSGSTSLYRLKKSVDAGLNWDTLYDGIPSGIQELTIDSDTENYPDRLYIGFYEGGFRIYDPTAFGSSKYKQIKSTTPQKQSAEQFDMNYIFVIAQDPNNDNHLLAGGTNNRYLAPTDGFYESFDRGETWTLIKGLPHGRDIWRIKFHPLRNQAFITTSSGTFVYEFDKNLSNSDVQVDQFVQKNVDSVSFNMYNVCNEYKEVKVVSAFYDRTTNVLDSAEFKNYKLAPLSSLEVSEDANDSFIQKLYFWSKTDNFPYASAQIID